jgi:hypothetical protein
MTPDTVLLQALSAFLRDDLQDELSGFKAYQNRVAVNLLELLARESLLGDKLGALDERIAREYRLDAGDMPAALSRAMRDGLLEDTARLRGYLKQRSLLALAIDNPRYSSYQRARDLWAEAAASVDALTD